MVHRRGPPNKRLLVPEAFQGHERLKR